VTDEEREILSGLVQAALHTDGGHHKQWYLEQIASQFELEIDNHHEPGIAP
jgi:hypothetical protein